MTNRTKTTLIVKDAKGKDEMEKDSYMSLFHNNTLICWDHVFYVDEGIRAYRTRGVKQEVDIPQTMKTAREKKWQTSFNFE